MPEGIVIRPPARLVLYGKHRARGDFIEVNLGPEMRRIVETWLGQALQDCRLLLGEGWDVPAPGTLPPRVMFWVGEAVAGETMAGVLIPSQDSVGRRFPLLIAAAGPPEAMPGPPLPGPPSSWFALLAPHLEAQIGRSDFESASDLLSGLDPPSGEQEEPVPAASFWATRPDSDMARLLADAAGAERRSAAATRSYWWQHREQGDGARLFATQGLPDGPALAWLLRQT